MIEGKIEKKTLRLRLSLAEGTLTLKNGEKTKIATSLNIDNQALFVEFPDLPDQPKIVYLVKDMINDAIDVMEKAKLLPEESP